MANARPPCACRLTGHAPKLVVLTGGPGAGKTAVLEVLRRSFCEHVSILPEAASIVFAGGFPRDTVIARRGAQRAIYHLQRELEEVALAERRAAVALCDRGMLDALAYWPDPPETFLHEVGGRRDALLQRYAAVIHLHTPPANRYDHSNPLRVESAREAAQIDLRIVEAWRDHPHRSFVDSTEDFVQKVNATVELIRREIPPCCAAHPLLPAGASLVAC